MEKPFVLRTFTGKLVDVANLKPADIDIVDIAHALSHQCRFAGHTQRFYSVAEHSLVVMDFIRKNFPADFRLQLTALLHDSSEAYLVDLPRPVKQAMPQYKVLEDAAMATIARVFNIEWPLPVIVKEVDDYVLKYELITIMAPASGIEMHGDTPRKVKNEFLKQFDRLSKW